MGVTKQKILTFTKTFL